MATSISAPMQESSRLPTSTSELILPIQSHNLSKTLTHLKKSSLSTSNRLHSIYTDAQFVQKVAATYRLPLVANERCGSWYIPTDRKSNSAYFKSTDGHHGQWSFSKRRLNLHLLQTIETAQGCIIVDSTRRGKVMPDALSKTIPIWCAVLNAIFFPERTESHLICTSRQAVDVSEQTQIQARFDRFVQDAKTLGLGLDNASYCLTKPLKPYWITPNRSSDLFQELDFTTYPVICCTASRWIQGEDDAEHGYVQGAGDDSENWAFGFTPEIFWANSANLLRGDPVETIGELRLHEQSGLKTSDPIEHFTEVGTTGLFIDCGKSQIEPSKISSFDGCIICDESPCTISLCETSHLSRSGSCTCIVLHLRCSSGKNGSRQLRSLLPMLRPFMTAIRTSKPFPSILLTCKTGTDLTGGIALALSCLYYDDTESILKSATGTYQTQENQQIIDKVFIRRRLAGITTANASINPSRATLQSVHAFLMPLHGVQSSVAVAEV